MRLDRRVVAPLAHVFAPIVGAAAVALAVAVADWVVATSPWKNCPHHDVAAAATWQRLPAAAVSTPRDASKLVVAAQIAAVVAAVDWDIHH